MGIIFKFPAILIYVVSGIWGLFICLEIVTNQLGFIGRLIAFIFLPVTLSFAPLYEGIANSNWFPVLLIYGGGIVGSVLYMIGAAIDND